jgi:hypothetical protein
MHIFNFTEKVNIYKVVYINNGWDINSPLSFQFDYSRTMKGQASSSPGGPHQLSIRDQYSRRQSTMNVKEFNSVAVFR